MIITFNIYIYIYIYIGIYNHKLINVHFIVSHNILYYILYTIQDIFLYNVIVIIYNTNSILTTLDISEFPKICAYNILKYSYTRIYIDTKLALTLVKLGMT